jgi:hypothetical protein
MLIGLRGGLHGAASTFAIEQGDALVLYTDGVTEAGRDLIAGQRRTLIRQKPSSAASFPKERSTTSHCWSRAPISMKPNVTSNAGTLMR